MIVHRLHRGEHALARVVADVGLIVEHARYRLGRYARRARHIFKANPHGLSGLVELSIDYAASTPVFTRRGSAALVAVTGQAVGVQAMNTYAETACCSATFPTMQRSRYAQGKRMLRLQHAAGPVA